MPYLLNSPKNINIKIIRKVNFINKWVDFFEKLIFFYLIFLFLKILNKRICLKILFISG